jgi:hypothetical protein
MKSHYLRNKLGRIVLSLFFLISIGVVSSASVQAQWWPQNQNRRDRDDRDYRRNRDNRRNDRGYGNDRYGQNGINQIAMNDGYQDGIYTGQRDAQRGQNYDPQRSHFYRNGHGDNGRYSNNGRYGGGYQYEQAYRDGFLRGYDQGFRQFARGNRRNGNGNYGRWPF